ncbi:MAG: biotin--acetyl-CoA-carboxylase ligase [Bryobacterales bacterium]|nr:biotin--acetyl-CoA-carboxylase ligase [Bryobacterales bacterium]
MSPERQIFRFAKVASTMQEAAALAAQGSPHGTAVVADEQTAGVGRHRHSWHSEPASGLYVSIILRLPLAPDALPIITLALGVATAEAITETTGLVCDIRWPNDIMLGGRKSAGILVQLMDNAAIAGIGVNVNHTGFPPGLAGEATSLRIATNRSHDRENLLTCLLASVDNICDILTDGGRAAILKMFSDTSSYATGKRVQVDLGDRTIHGVTAGLNDSGFLLVRKPDSTIETIIAGGVRPA